jgi:DNA-binding NtrC family response regulator
LDALVTDFATPSTNGIDVLPVARTRWPKLGAILLTGHVRNTIATPVDRVSDRLIVNGNRCARQILRHSSSRQ